MWQAIFTTMASVFTKETLASIGNAILSSQVRKTFRRAIRDVVEDEVSAALFEKGLTDKEVKKYIRNNKSRLKDEIRARFDVILLKD